jgi:2'-5' RNA ligase
VPYAIELYPDPKTEGVVRATWQQLAAAGIDDGQLVNDFRPHVSVAVCDDVDFDALHEAMVGFAEETEPFPLTLSSFGLFPSTGVLFLLPVPTPTLLAAHARFHELCGRHMKDLVGYYQPGRWIPHCTMAQRIAAPRISRALGAVWETALPIEGRFMEVGVSEFRPTVLRSLFPLGGAEPEADPSIPGDMSE